MTSVGLNIGLRGLLTAQSALDTVGHNITNANTEGYSRQRLQISAGAPIELRGLYVGSGVEGKSISRTVDGILTRRIVSQVSTVSRLDSMMVGLKGVEALLGEPGGFGLGQLMSDWFASVADLSTDPQDIVFRTGVTQAASSMTSQFHQVAEELDTQSSDAFARVDAFVGEVNIRAEQVVALNREISRVEASGGDANDLRDERDLALRELGKQIDTTFYEDANGAVRVLIDGQLLAGHTTVNPLSAKVTEGRVEVFVKGGTQPIDPSGGEIGGLIELAHEFIPEFQGQLDKLARSLILETNRVHSVGVPPSGGFKTLNGAYAVKDADGDGLLLDERLVSAGLPFDLREGRLFVNLVDEESGDVRTETLDVDPSRMTVGELLDAFNAIDELSASLDSQGRLKLTAGSGVRFDFSRRLDPTPDAAGTFGGGRASHGSGEDAPFDLIAGSTLQLTGPTGAVTVTFQPGQFADMSAATAAEVANAINDEAGMQANQLRAVAVDDRVFLQSVDEGAGQSFTITGGTAAGALGFTAGTTVTGHDTAVAVEIGGSHRGEGNEQLTFRPLSDGAIGTTPGLQVEVLDANGITLATLDVGEGYLPGNELDVGNGLTVSFGFGNLSATDRDEFVLPLIGDPDSADLLVAFGLNSFYVGTDAETIEVREDIAADPSLIAASASGAEGDNGTLLDMMGLQTEEVESLGASFGEYYGGVIGEVGFTISSTENSLQVEQFLYDSLNERRDQVSGVNVDEELVDMIQYEQAYGAAAQFLQVVNQLHDEVLNLL